MKVLNKVALLAAVAVITTGMPVQANKARAMAIAAERAAALKAAEAEAAAVVAAPVAEAPVAETPVAAPVAETPVAAPAPTPVGKTNIAQVATYKSGSSVKPLFYKNAAGTIAAVSTTKLAKSDVISTSYGEGLEVVKRYTTSVWFRDPKNSKCYRINMPVPGLSTGDKVALIGGGSDKTGYSMVNQGTLPTGCVTASSKGTANLSFPVVAVLK